MPDTFEVLHKAQKIADRVLLMHQKIIQEKIVLCRTQHQKQKVNQYTQSQGTNKIDYYLMRMIKIETRIKR